MTYRLEPPARVKRDIGVYPGVITRVDGSYAWVEIADLAPGFEYGPCAVPSDWRTWTHIGHGAMSEDTEPEHTLQELAVGTKVTVLLTAGEHYMLARY